MGLCADSCGSSRVTLGGSNLFWRILPDTRNIGITLRSALPTGSMIICTGGLHPFTKCSGFHLGLAAPLVLPLRSITRLAAARISGDYTVMNFDTGRSRTCLRAPLAPSCASAGVLSPGRLYTLAAASTLAALAGLASGQGVVFPPDARIYNVGDYGAIPNDGLDDTAAFQAAIQANVDLWRIIYIPDGVYDFDDRINWGSGGNRGFPFGHALRFQGQSRENTKLRLRANNPLFQNSAATRVFLDVYEGNTANAFGNEIHDLSIEVGAGNPGAVALQFQSNNTGSMRNVSIRSLDPAGVGATGLDFGFNFPGPLLVSNISIDGFETGVVGAPQEYSVTFDGLTLRNQRTLGMYFWRLPAQIHNLISINDVPVIRNAENPGAWGHIVLRSANITTNGNGGGVDAIINEDGAGIITLQDVTVSGYRNAVSDLEGTAPVTLPNGVITSHTTDGVRRTRAAAPSLMLANEPAPLFTAPLSEWASVEAFGANGQDALDDTDGVRAALKSGKPIVYFPRGQYIINDTLEVGPAVRRIIGLKSFVSVGGGLYASSIPLFRVGPGQNEVIIEGLNESAPAGVGRSWFVTHAAANTLALKDGGVTGYRNTVGGGVVHFENIVGKDFVFDSQKVFARQLNPEGDGVKIRNIGGDAFLLGVKTEGQGMVVQSLRGARTQVLGGLSYPATVLENRAEPMFESVDSSTWLSMPESCYIANGYYDTWVTDTRGGSSLSLLRGQIGRGHSNCGLNLGLYEGGFSDGTPSSQPGSVNVSVISPNELLASWGASSDSESGIARYNVYANGTLVHSTGENSSQIVGLADDTEYTIRVEAVNGVGLTSEPAEATSTTSAFANPVIIQSADSPNSQTIVLTFTSDTALNTAAAQNPASYIVTGGGSLVGAAVLSPDGRMVTLTVLGSLIPGIEYAISAPGVLNTSTTPAGTEPGSQLTFAYGVASAGTGVNGEYYNDRELTGTPVLTRNEPVINFPYGTGGPGTPVNNDNFSARWSGSITPLFSEEYTFLATTDDGVRLWIDGGLVINDWNTRGPTTSTANVTLMAGKRYDFVMEYFEATGGGSCVLEWQSPRQAREVVPASQFTPTRVLREVRTADGGADTVLYRPDDTDGGTQQGLNCVNDDGQNFFFHQASMLRFDVSTLNLAGSSIDDAQLTMMLTGFGVGSSTRMVYAYGLRESAGADNWIETGPGRATWANTPGVTPSGYAADGAVWEYLGNAVVDNTGFRLSFRPDSVIVRSPQLRSFLATDTDGVVTILLKRATGGFGENTSFGSKEFIPRFSPALKVALSDLPVGCPADFNQDGGVDGADVEAFFEEWSAGNPRGDFNQDGGVDGTDVETFFERWSSGC